MILINISVGTGIPYPTLMIYLKEENASESSVTAALNFDEIGQKWDKHA